MAIASITITCTECGKKAEYRKSCYNRSEANEFERWASTNITTCKACYAKQMAKQAEREVAEALSRNGLTLPTLTGVSDKQIAYAESKRMRYLTDNLARIDNYSEEVVYINEQLRTRGDEIAEDCRQCDKTVDDVIAEWLAYYGYTTLHYLMSATEARAVLDALR